MIPAQLRGDLARICDRNGQPLDIAAIGYNPKHRFNLRNRAFIAVKSRRGTDNTASWAEHI